MQRGRAKGNLRVRVCARDRASLGGSAAISMAASRHSFSLDVLVFKTLLPGPTIFSFQCICLNISDGWVYMGTHPYERRNLDLRFYAQFTFSAHVVLKRVCKMLPTLLFNWMFRFCSKSVEVF